MSQGQTVKSEPNSSEQNNEEVHSPPPNQDDPAYQADNERDMADDTGTKGKGKLVTTQHGIIKRPKRVRKFKCKYVTMYSTQQKNGTNTMRRIILSSHV